MTEYFLWFQLSEGCHSHPAQTSAGSAVSSAIPTNTASPLETTDCQFCLHLKKINPITSLEFKFHDLEQNWMSRISREFCVQFTEECSPQMLLFSVFDIILPLWLVQRGKAAMILLALTWDKLKHRIGVAAWVTRPRSPCWRRCSSRDGIIVVKCVGCTYKSYSKVYWGSIAQKFVKHLGILVVLNIKECWSVELLWCTCCQNWEHAKGSKYMKYE